MPLSKEARRMNVAPSCHLASALAFRFQNKCTRWELKWGHASYTRDTGNGPQAVFQK